MDDGHRSTPIAQQDAEGALFVNSVKKWMTKLADGSDTASGQQRCYIRKGLVPSMVTLGLTYPTMTKIILPGY